MRQRGKIEQFRKQFRARVKNIEFMNDLLKSHSRRNIRNEIERLEGEISRKNPALRAILAEAMSDQKNQLEKYT